MSEQELVAAIEAALDAATARGQWEQSTSLADTPMARVHDPEGYAVYCANNPSSEQGKKNAHLIANAPKWLRQCVARIKEQNEVIQTLNFQCDRFYENCQQACAGESVATDYAKECLSRAERAEADLALLRSTRDTGAKLLAARTDECDQLKNRITDLEAEVERLRDAGKRRT